METHRVHTPFGTGDTGLIGGFMNGDFYDTPQRAILFGIKKGCDKLNFHASVYGFDSALKDNRNDGGASMTINFKQNDLSGAVAGGIVSNTLESKLYQKGGDKFAGFAVFKNTTGLKPMGRVVGWTIYGTLSFKSFDLRGEFVTAGKKLSKMFFMQNGKAIQPCAFNVEGTYTFKIARLPTMFTVGYGRTKYSAAFDKPEHRVSAAVILEPLKSTLFGVEFVHDIDYGKKTTYQYWGLEDGAKTPMLMDQASATGKTKNTLNVFLGYYF